MRNCSKCKQQLDDSNFSIINRKTNLLDRYCKICRSNARRDWYARNKKEHIATVLSNHARYEQEYKIWRKNFSCVLCDEKDSCCIDFHHLDPSVKEYTIANMKRCWTIERIQEEVKKCIAVCSNCHRKIHTHGLETVAKAMNKWKLFKPLCQKGK